MRDWRPTLGAVHTPAATTFRVWAPEATSVDLILAAPGHSGRGLPLQKDEAGYWSAIVDGLPAGARYRYRLNGDDRRTFPDPASRFQPEGVHGPSQVIDPAAFVWTDQAWQAPPRERLVFYELHVGTFTDEGTFRGVIGKLPYLRALGVTAIEIMPIADFPGDRNWGYDGVALFAPARCYGSPDDFRALVDAAHNHGLAVFLDVVYNHMGPDGAYANAFSPYYFTDAHESPWGKGVNLDGQHAVHVRRFFIETALHWTREYHLDGLRLDATHAMQDDSPRHFLAELTATLRRDVPQPLTIVAEDHRNLPHMLRPEDEGGYGLDAVWADDFHHQARVHTAHDREGYYAQFTGSIEDIAATLRRGWFRGADPAGLRPEQFVLCIQNHDQVGNRADGARLNQHVDAPTYRALSVLLLLAPETPLLFMGQEWAASTPFLFFTDHEPDLGRRVTEGRRQEFSAFEAFSDPARRDTIPDPQSPRTFERSRLLWREAANRTTHHAYTRHLYQRLLRLRKGAAPGNATALDAHTIQMTAGGLTVIARLSGGGAVVIRDAGVVRRNAVLTTEDVDVTMDSKPIEVDTAASTLRFARPGAIVFAP